MLAAGNQHYMNTELLEMYMPALQEITFTLEWLKPHSGHSLNKAPLICRQKDIGIWLWMQREIIILAYTQKK